MKKIILLLAGLATFLFSVPPVYSASEPFYIYYAGPADNVRQALTLTKAQQQTAAFTTDANQANVFVFNDSIPNDSRIAARIQSGEAGLALFLGPDLTQQQVGALLGYPLTFEKRTDPVSPTNLNGVNDPLLTEIVWNGAPQVRERYVVTTPVSSVQPLVIGYEDNEWIAWSARGGKDFVFNAFLTNDFNPQIQQWAYFNYMIYQMTQRAAGRSYQSFADWPGSPVPHTIERDVLWAVMGLMIVTTFGAYFLVRRYSLNHPEALDQIVSDRAKFEVREEATEWEDIGFHRPLSGFLVALSMGLVMFIPLIIYQNLILPVYILPSAEALGIWGRVTQFFNLAWYFFDMGTSTAFIKYLSQHRVNDPKRGIKFGQMFVWWQALSGAVQVALVIGLASTLAPRSAYALYAWSVIIHSFIQVPGFYQVMRHALNGFQRQDYARYLDVALNVVLPVIIQPIFVGVMYAWGKSNPVYGAAMGGLYGLGIAAYMAELTTFLIGLWLYRRIGYNARVLFLAHFDWEIVKTGFKFGVFEMLGSVAWSIGQAAEIWITQARLVNYAEIWGNWGLAQNFVFAFQILQTLYDGAMPAISESISHVRKVLSQYYSVMAYKYGGMISAFLGAVLLAVADRFILGASGPEFERAAVYALPLAVWGAIQYPSWVGDNVQLGSNKPYLKSTLVFGEQTIRIVFAWILIARFQIVGLIIAYFIGLLTKDIVAYFVNHKLCFPQKFYAWQSLFAPILAAAAHYALLRWLTGLIWQDDQITSVLIFFIGILPSFPVFMFFYGFFGGWDDATLNELKDAVELTGALRPLAWVVWASTALGARISPLHGRFPIMIRAEAVKEAEALTREKVKL
jgi:O-antigen/teichoic acid export membrane protein